MTKPPIIMADRARERRKDFNFEARSTKFETISKFQFLKLRNVFLILNLGFGICFGFLISEFFPQQGRRKTPAFSAKVSAMVFSSLADFGSYLISLLSDKYFINIS